MKTTSYYLKPLIRFFMIQQVRPVRDDTKW